MEKRYIAIYLYGFLFSVLLFVVLYFVDFHYLAFHQGKTIFWKGNIGKKCFLKIGIILVK